MRILQGFAKGMHMCRFGSDEIPKGISGLLVDRIDIHIEVPRVDYEKLSGDRLGETSESIRTRVQTARDIQNRRFADRESL